MNLKFLENVEFVKLYRKGKEAGPVDLKKSVTSYKKKKKK